MPDKVHDLIVIGAGPAGERAAVEASAFGLKVALIEKASLLGGTVANLGTLPSKTLREAAAYLHGFKQRGLRGMTLTLQDHLNAQEFLNRERLLRQLEQARIRAHLDQSRVRIHHGYASFVDDHTVKVLRKGGGEELFAAEKVLIACGSSPVRPAVFSEDNSRVFDARTVTHMTEMPRILAIVGGGVIGCEYASIFAAFGIQVHLVEGGSKLLPFLDADVSSELLSTLRTQGVEVHLNEEPVSFMAGDNLSMTLGSGRLLVSDAILLATGRQGNTQDLNLEAAGLEVGKQGLLSVNRSFQTAKPHIYAVGDVIGFPALASSAREQASQAVAHAFGSGSSGEVQAQPYGIYTIPECAMAGETEEVLRRRGEPLLVGIAHYAGNARGQLIGAKSGFLKLIFQQETKRLLGVHVIGEQASELVHLGLIALRQGAGTDLFLGTSFNYPTLGDLYRSATQDALSVKQASGLLRPSLDPR